MWYHHFVCLNWSIKKCSLIWIILILSNHSCQFPAGKPWRLLIKRMTFWSKVSRKLFIATCWVKQLFLTFGLLNGWVSRFNFNSMINSQISHPDDVHCEIFSSDPVTHKNGLKALNSQYLKPGENYQSLNFLFAFLKLRIFNPWGKRAH